MAFPSTLTNAVDGATDIIAAHLNNLEAKVGVDGSAVVSSLDYLLKNGASVDPGHKHDHGGLNGLGDDDHTQYIKHALATATDDFLVASGAGAYVKKTLAETKAILELPASPYVIGDMFYASSTTVQAKLAAVAVNNVLISGGVGAPFSWGKVGLTTHVDGILPVANGGTGSATGSITGTGALVLAAGGSDQDVTLTPSGTGDTILNGNIGIGTTSFGTSAAKVLGIGSGTAPATAPADMAQLWVEDVNAAAGFAGLHKRTETTNQKEVVPGVIIKTDTGSPANPYEGLMEINTFDNKIRMYADAGWRELGTW